MEVMIFKRDEMRLRWIILDTLVFVPFGLALEWLESVNQGEPTHLATYGWAWLPWLAACGCAGSLIFRLWTAHKQETGKRNAKSKKRLI